MRLLPAHGPVTDTTHARVHALLAHHEDRLNASLDRVQAGAHTAYEVALALPWTRRARRFSEARPVQPDARGPGERWRTWTCWWRRGGWPARPPAS